MPSHPPTFTIYPIFYRGVTRVCSEKLQFITSMFRREYICYVIISAKLIYLTIFDNV